MKSWLQVITPWFWKARQMPAREVAQLTLRQADAYVTDWVEEQEAGR